MFFPQLLVLLLLVLVPLSAVHALPLVDPGLFVILGVRSCRAGEGYCLLGHDCTLDEDFLPDDQNGHCDGLRSAFTPSAHFTCCKYSEEVANTTDQNGDSTDWTTEEPDAELSTTTEITTPYDEEGTTEDVSTTEVADNETKEESESDAKVEDGNEPNKTKEADVTKDVNGDGEITKSDNNTKNENMKSDVIGITTPMTVDEGLSEEKSNKTDKGNESKLKLKNESLVDVRKKQRKDDEDEVRSDENLNSVDFEINATKQSTTIKKVSTPTDVKTTQGGSFLNRLDTHVQYTKQTATPVAGSTEKRTSDDSSPHNPGSNSTEVALLSTTTVQSSKVTSSDDSLNSITSNAYIKSTAQMRHSTTTGPVATTPNESTVNPNVDNRSDVPSSTKSPTFLDKLSVDLSTYAIVDNTTKVIGQGVVNSSADSSHHVGSATNDTTYKSDNERELPTTTAIDTETVTTESDVAKEPHTDNDTSTESWTETLNDERPTENTLLYPMDVRFGNFDTDGHSNASESTELLNDPDERLDNNAEDTGATTEQRLEVEERIENSMMCIGGGGPAPEDNCWLVQFRDSRSGSILCSGTLLTSQKVVTSASCAIRVYTAGVENVTMMAGGHHMQEQRVLDLAVHEEYRRKRNDLGLIRLKPALTRLASECAVCLADPEKDLSTQSCVVLVADPTHPSGVTRHPCNRVAMSRHGPGADKVMCTAAPSVQVQTGSPLVCGGELAGVASRSEHGNAFTPTSQFISWIQGSEEES